MSQTGRRPLPPYVAYRTFVNYLGSIRSRGVPSRVDRTALPHKSGAVQSQLLLALTYLGLIDEHRVPTPAFHELVAAEGAERRKLLRQLLASSYAFLADDVDLSKATSEQLEERFAATGVSGETLRRAQSFFLAMAKEAGVAVSPYIQPHRGRRKRKAAQPEPPAPPPPAAPTLPARGPGPREGTIRRSVRLRGGGTVTLSFDGNALLLDAAEREFLFGLADALAAYSAEDGD